MGTPKYIVIYDSPFEQEFEFFESIEQVKQYIKDTFIINEELHKVRVFKIDSEIEILGLGLTMGIE